MRGYWGVGIYHPKTEVNVGGLFRSAQSFGASFVFTVGRRYKRQASDTTAASRHVPLIHYATIEDMVEHLPHGCPLVGVELDPRAVMLDRFQHPERACYLLGAEDHGLTPNVLERCHHVVQVPNGKFCLNVATTGGIIMYDRSVRFACAA